MELELSKRQLDELAHKVAVIVAKRLREQEDTPEMVTTTEAARILGVTPQTMRRNQHKYPHVKGGENKQGKLLFVRDALLKNY